MIAIAHTERDDGFSLAELIIVIGLIGFIVAAAWGVSAAMVQAGRANETQTVFARDSGEPIRIANKAIMQAIEVEGSYCTSQAIQVITDPQMNSNFQRVRVSATTDGRLRYEVWQLDSAKAVVSKIRDVRFSDGHVSNFAKGIRLFTYYDQNNAEITDSALIGSDTKAVLLQLSLTANKTDTVSSQTVMLRNMQL